MGGFGGGGAPVRDLPGRAAFLAVEYSTSEKTENSASSPKAEEKDIYTLRDFILQRKKKNPERLTLPIRTKRKRKEGRSSGT